MRIRGFAPATPCWVELASADPGRAQTFYAGLFGWEPVAERFTLGGYAAAGLTRTRPGRPAGWLPYLAADDLGAAVQRFAAAGGRCLSGPVAGPGGRGAVVADPRGATLGLWQADDFAGAQVGGEPGTMTWPELLTDDPVAAAGFYGRALGWLLRDEAGGDGRRGEWLTPAHNAVAGLAPSEHPAGGERVDRWRCAFQVADCDAAVRLAGRLGAVVLTPPTDMGVGSYAELRDPAGASFAVAAPSGLPVELTLAFHEIAGMELTFGG